MTAHEQLGIKDATQADVTFQISNDGHAAHEPQPAKQSFAAHIIAAPRKKRPK
jgi:hypothetical protein